MTNIPTRAQRIESTLRAALAAEFVAVTDDSAQHAGHAGASPSGETHYTVLVVASQFRGQNRVTRHRAINATLASEFATGLHALALIARTPEEQDAAKNQA